jgi:putative FmdB family regulatory protein
VPIYEFICQSCGNEFEQIRSFSDSSMPECAKCGSSEVVRRMGRPAIHFKGSGWYINDSKKSNEKNGKESSKSVSDSAKSESALSNSTESTTAGSSETKSENKTETKSTSESKSAPAPVASD